jgi:hypothetical protein
VLIVQAFLTCVAGLICVAMSARPRTVLLSAGAAMGLSYSLVLLSALTEINERAALREKFPLESVAHRLDYKKQRQQVPRDGAEASTEVVLSAEVEVRLNDLESQYGSRRQYALDDLHNRMKDQFIVARGFGSVRMRAHSIPGKPGATSG